MESVVDQESSGYTKVRIMKGVEVHRGEKIVLKQFVNNWKRTVRSKQYNSGQIRHFRLQQWPRNIKGMCQKNCQRVCTSHLNANEQIKIHNTFWGLGNQKRRADFIA